MEIQPQELDIETFKKIHSLITPDNESIALLDLRDRQTISKEGIIPKSISIHKNLPFERFIGQMITPYSKIVIVLADNSEAKDVYTRLHFMTYKNILGHITFENWVKDSNEVDKILEEDDISKITSIVDVREPWEWKNAIIDVQQYEKDKELIQMRMLWSNYYWQNLDKSKNYHVLCQSGIRSYITASYLRSKGLNAINFKGGMENVLKLGYKVIRK